MVVMTPKVLKVKSACVIIDLRTMCAKKAHCYYTLVSCVSVLQKKKGMMGRMIKRRKGLNVVKISKRKFIAA